MTGIYLFDDLKEIIPFNHSKGSHSYLNQVIKTLGDPICQNWEPIHEFHRDEDFGNYFCSSGKDCIILQKCGIVYNICNKSNDYRHYHCSCGEATTQIYEFENKKIHKKILIGCVCYRKFGQKADEIMDNFQGKKKCEKCKKTVNKQIVNEYEKQETFYHKSCLKKTFDICKKCKKYKKYDCECKTIVDYLELNTEEPEPPSYETVVPVAPVYQTVVPIAPIFRINPITTIVKIGKFKGKPLSDLLKDVNYCDWIKSVEEPSGKLKEIQEYLLSAQSV